MKEAALYLTIANAIERQIHNNVLKTGDKLPSIRTVKREYGVSMSTASRAFFELERKALIESRPQSGFYVCRHTKNKLLVPTISNPSILPHHEQAEDLIGKVYQSLNDTSITRFSIGVPANELLPIAKLNKGLIQATRTLGGSGTAYEEIQGNFKLRRNIARWSFTWGGTLAADDLVTTAGAMNALSYCMMALTQKGDTIAVESPVYFGILQLAKSLGLQVMEIPTHPITGIELEALQKVLPTIKLCLVVSNFNNPLGSCMPEENKKLLVDLLAAHEIPLIEDDLYGDVYFGENRPRPCKAFDKRGLVLWCGSVSKTLAPGYRVGWVAPGKFKEQIIRLKLLHAVSSTTLTQEVIGDFLENGRYEAHLRKMRRTLQANSLHFTRAIHDYFPEDTRVSRPQGGFVLWVELNQHLNTAVLYDQAMRRKVSFAPGRMFTLQNQFNNCMRLSYGLQWSDGLEKKLALLGSLARKMTS